MPSGLIYRWHSPTQIRTAEEVFPQDLRLVVVVTGFNNTNPTTEEALVLYEEWSECVLWRPDGCNSASANWRRVIMCDDKFHLGWKPIIRALIKAVAVVGDTVCRRFPCNPWRGLGRGVGGWGGNHTCSLSVKATWNIWVPHEALFM